MLLYRMHHLWLSLALCCIAPAASAAPIVWEFQGVVGPVFTDGPIDPGVATGNIVRGSLTFDPSLATGGCTPPDSFNCNFVIPASMQMNAGSHVLDASLSARFTLSEVTASITFEVYSLPGVLSQLTYDGQALPVGSYVSWAFASVIRSEHIDLPRNDYPLFDESGFIPRLFVTFYNFYGSNSGFQAGTGRITVLAEPSALHVIPSILAFLATMRRFSMG